MIFCGRNPVARKLAVAAMLAALALLCASGCSQPPAQTEVIDSEPAPGPDPELVRLSSEAIQVANIRVASVEKASLPTEIRVAGRVTVNENVTARVGSFAEGTVVECCEPVGVLVKKGQVLARLHSHEVHDAESNHRRAHEDLQRSRAELEYAEQAYRRASRLYELKAGSLQQVQEAETRLKGTEAAVAIAQAELRRAESHLRYLGIKPPDLDHGDGGSSAEHDPVHDTHLLEVRSPIAGMIIERPVSPGAVVTPSAPLYVISDLSSVWVIAQVPEENLSMVREGMPVEISVRAYPDRTFPARITNIGATLDPETRTVQVRCEAPNPGRRLKTEMYASVLIRAGTGQPAVVVPVSAMQQVDGEPVVFVPVGEGGYRVRRVETGRQSGSRMEILGGLEAGGEVVVEGAFHLKSELLKGRMVEEE